MQEKISFLSNGSKIVGIIDLPEKTPCPCVAMFHGGTNTKENAIPYQLIVEKLLALGVASLRIDFFGTGESDGLYLEKTYAIQDMNIIDALDFISEDKRFTDIGVLGRSQSGGQLLYLDHKSIVARVLHGPSIHPYTHIQKSYPSILKDLNTNPEKKWSNETKEGPGSEPNVKGELGFSRALIEEMPIIEKKALAKMPELKNICLFLGDKDAEKTVEDILEIYHAIQEPKELHIMSNANYKWTGVENEVAELTVSWFKRVFNKQEN